MILEEESYREFGYYSNELSPKSSKQIIASCDSCGKIRHLKKRDYRALCRSCVHKGEKNPMFGMSGEKSPNYGKHHSEETKKKIGDANRNPSEETRLKIGKGNRGKKLSIETRMKISIAHKGLNAGENSYMYGKHHTEESSRKISESVKKYYAENKHPNSGKPMSEEQKKKISKTLKGRFAGEKNPMFGMTGEKSPNYGKHHSEETKKKISDAKMNPSEETRKKLSEAQMGKKHSEETKNKISDLRKGNYCGENNPNYGKHHSEETKMKIGAANKGRKTFLGKHHSEETKIKIREARKHQKFPTHHTKPEMIFEGMCKKYDLQFKYTGDGSFWIGDINPDFVECNGRKIAVEIFSYWHDPLRRRNIPYARTYAGRQELLNQYGWKLIVFWQEDLEGENAEKFVLSKLEN